MVVEKTAPYPKSHPNPTRKCSRMDAPGAQKKTIDDQSVVFFCLLSCTKEKNRLSQNYTPKLSNMKIAIKNHSKHEKNYIFDSLTPRRHVLQSFDYVLY